MENSQNMRIFDWDLFRRDVRRDVRNCALFMFFFYVTYLIAAIVTMAVFTVSNTSIITDLSSGNLEEGLEGSVTDLLNGAVGPMSIISIIVGSLVFFILRKHRFITDLAMPVSEPLTPKIFIILVLATQAIQLVYSLIIMIVDELLPEGVSLADSYGEAMEGLFTPLGVLYVVLIGPVFEELIFRGAVMGNLRRYGDNFAIIISSILFGFYHAIFLQIPFAFVVGLLLGYAASRWSLRVSIALHIIVNGLSVLISDVGNDDLATAGGLIMIVCTGLTVIFAIKWRKILKARIAAGAAFYPNTYKYGFSSVAFWLFLTAMAGFALFQLLAI